MGSGIMGRIASGLLMGSGIMGGVASGLLRIQTSRYSGLTGENSRLSWQMALIIFLMFCIYCVCRGLLMVELRVSCLAESAFTH